MKIFHSIRWRMQLWHGLILIAVLIGFGWAAWHLQQSNQNDRIDRELEQRIGLLRDISRPRNGPPVPPGSPGGGPRFDPQEKAPPFRPERGLGAPARMPRWEIDLDNMALGEREAELFKGGAKSDFYFIVWNGEGQLVMGSEGRPEGVRIPNGSGEPLIFRNRGELRECAHFTPNGVCILVGRDIGLDRGELARFAWIMTGAGFVVLGLGLIGGWWLSSRAIRPVSEIGATAKRISGGDLSQRIQTTDTDSELGELVGVLNGTFERLQNNFERQAQFTADASHELRTPVTVLLTQTQSALARERSPAEYRESLAACQRAAVRMRQLTESLLTLARLDTADDRRLWKPCGLQRVVLDMVEQLKPIAKAAKVQLKVTAEEVEAICDPGQIAQVVSNLVSNAIHYNGEGGQVEVTLEASEGKAVLKVMDTGVGIAEADLPHIFKRFYRADKARTHAQGRTGLGLAIVDVIVTAHGGTIEVKSTEGQGSEFTVSLPKDGSEVT